MPQYILLGNPGDGEMMINIKVGEHYRSLSYSFFAVKDELPNKEFKYLQNLTTAFAEFRQ
jgi:hypothetical protein